ncbi:M48 family metalloprotease [Kitasatospora sp. NPDC048540]|uniref:M48 family metallopeptidase n=1 Tax=unclassified Kitasatospora TaxID=2633591 RepID=UPI00068B630B|nr:M48 family metallopeptidase [Kitasatospora sp. MBT63]
MAAIRQPAALRTSTRAAQAVALLIGFYLFAAAIVAGLLALDIALYLESDHLRPGLLKIWALTALVIYPVLRVVFLTRRPEAAEGPGLPVTREEQPELWARVDRLAELTGVRGPARIRLTPDVNAGVREDTRLLGLIPGPRHLEIGVPLLIGLSRAELDAVLAHEFGHFGNQDVRLAGVTVAGRTAILHTIGTLHERADRHQAEEAAEIRARAEDRLARGRTPRDESEGSGGVQRALARIFTWYAKLFFRVSESVSRRQEYAADLAAARIAGRRATASALRKIRTLGAAQDFYLRSYATIGWDAGLLPVPGQVYGGLAELLADPGRRAELAALGLDLPEEQADPYDSHPPIAQRVAAIEALPADGLESAEDGAGALALLRDPERTLAALEAATLAPAAAAKRRVDWPELVDRGHLAHAREAGQPILRALTGSGLHGTVDALLDAVDAGRGPEIAGRLPGSERATPDALRPALRSGVARLAVLALAEAGLAHWELSWSETAVLALPDGMAEGFDAALDAVVADRPDTAPLRALLTAAGLPPATA